MKKKIKLVYIFFMFIGLKGFSQGGNNDFFSMKNFTPPTPNQAAISRYGEIPVDFSTGLPSISIPIFEVTSNKIPLSVSLDYHASGIRVEDISSTVGLGWVLRCGGTITRTIIGLADEQGILVNARRLKNRSELEGLFYNGEDFFDLNMLSSGVSDSQSDYYNISMPGISGQFVYDTLKRIVFSGVDKQIKIERNNNKFKVIDEDGTVYIFNEEEQTLNWSKTSNTTTWHISSIISADYSDTIVFKYISGTPFKDTLESYSLMIDAPINTDPMVGCEQLPDVWNYATSANYYTYYPKLIDSVIFSNGYINFLYQSDRKDRGGFERLIKIRMGNLNGLVKETELKQSYFLSVGSGFSHDLHRLRLDSVVNKDNALEKVNTYKFGYNPLSLPSYKYNYNYKNTQIDFWGYYNGKSQNSLLPKGQRQRLKTFIENFYYVASNSYLDNYDAIAADRMPDPLYTQACILSQITYPTGGSSFFEYENNRIANNGNSADYVGGVRVKRLASIEPGSKDTLVKTYLYGEGANGLGMPISKCIPEDFIYDIRTLTWKTSYGGSHMGFCTAGTLYFTANPINSFGSYNGAPIFYTKVTELLGKNSTHIGKTEYTYKFEIDSIYSVDYLNKYWNFNTSRPWMRGKLLNQKVYRSLSEHEYVLTKELSNYYQDYGRRTVKIGQICEVMTDMRNSSLEAYMANIAVTPSGDRLLLTHFDYVDVYLSYGVEKLVRTEEKEYIGVDSIQKIEQYYYEGNNHLYLTSKNSQLSNQKTFLTTFKYPQDKANLFNLSPSASSGIDTLLARNNLHLVLENEEYQDNVFLKSKRVDFKNWGIKGNVYPEFVHTKIKQNDIETKVEYLSYDDQGNVTSLKYQGGESLVFMWGYRQRFLIAEVTDALVNNVFHTSFEDMEDGFTLGGKTGRKSALYGFSKHLSGLTNGNYVLSYWVNVGGIWSYVENSITVTTGSYTINITGHIDEIRFYPQYAKMVTYTYEPHVGVLTKCDINNIITYYEYDNTGRLAVIRDQYKRIIKTICYNYAGQVEACGIVSTLPQWESTSLTRCQPCAANNSYTSNIQEYQEKDNNPNSATYNTYRWVSDGVNSNCMPQADWQNTATAIRCKKNENNQNTGEQEREQRDMNPCSANYNQLRWIVTGTNLTSCPLPPTCNSSNCSGESKKCINGVCETGIRVCTDSVYDPYSGMYFNTYHYEWSDNSWSSNYTELTEFACF